MCTYLLFVLEDVYKRQTLNNIGPGLELVGPTQNFALFSPLSKCVLMFDMLAGRLELFPMLVIMLPSCWKKY